MPVKSLCAVLLILTLLSTPAAAAPAALPAGFVDEAIANVGDIPTGLAETPDGRLLIATKGGQLRVVQNGALLAAPALNLNGILCTDFERGIENVAVDPDFANNNRIYVYYTHNGGSGGSDCSANSAARNRVARYGLNGNSAQSPAVILDRIASPCGNHNGGGLGFDTAGLLYISTGDGGCALSGVSNNAREPGLLNGKILRITTDGAIPPGNPNNAVPGAVVCNAAQPQPGRRRLSGDVRLRVAQPVQVCLQERHGPVLHQ